MHEASTQFLESLLLTPSPPGYESAIQEHVRAWARNYADEVVTDRHGNVIAVRNPGAEPRVMFAGHCDQLALMVQYIDDQGFLYVQPMGGWDIMILLGQKLTVWTRTGPLPGVVARKAPHLLTADDRKKVPEFTDVWVDIGAASREEAQSTVAIGDTITVELGVRWLHNELAVAAGMDDKVGVWVVMEALRLLHGKQLAGSFYFVSTVQEEIGLRGATTSAYGIHPHVGVAIDVTHATDTPGQDKKQIGEAKLGLGPVLSRGPNVNPRVHELFVQTAKEDAIDVQIRAHPRGTGTDANAIQLSRDGVAAGLIGIPNRYMHSPVEMVSLRDLDRSAQLVAGFCRRIRPELDWRP
ncbi:MAG TPA: M42 family metallopeptidase [Gemmatales bacterium]|nr:M42 family metallopeptidase [Gemmatales bacterium]HMP60681.1 M42 family metallopeptidase [Gemmatales bacterium]